MEIKAQDVKKFREETGVGMMDAKQALIEAKGDMVKAREIIRKKGLDKIAKKADRQAHEGVVEAYIHANGKIGVLVQVSCETDFVAKNEDFKAMAHEIAMQVAASDPKWIKPEDADEKELAKEKEIWAEELKQEGKPEEMISKIMEGKSKKYTAEASLLKQPLVKNPDLTVEDLLAEMTNKLGEKMEIIRFVRFAL